MATLWQYPRSYTAGELIVSSHMNREIRDNMLASEAVVAETVITSTTTYQVVLTPPSTIWNNWRAIVHCAVAQAASFQFLLVGLNSDLSSAYQSAGLDWIPTSTAAGTSTGYVASGVAGTGLSLVRPPNADRAPAMGSYVVNVGAVNSTRYKLITAMSASPWSSVYLAVPQVEMASAIWRSTAAVMSIAFQMDLTSTTTFSTGSVFTLIGLP